MLFSTWLRNRTPNRAPRGRVQHRPAARRFRPVLEALEDRRVPAAITLIQNIGAVASSPAGATSLSIPVKHAVAPGHRVTVEFAELEVGNYAPTPTITDTAGNAYAIEHDISFGAPGGSGLQFIASALVSSPIPAGGAITVTLDFSSPPLQLPVPVASAQEFYGLSSVPHLFSGGGSWDLSGTATTASVEYDIGQAPALALASFAIGDTPANTLTLDSASTALPGAGTTTAIPNVTIAPGFRVVTTTGKTSITGTTATPTFYAVLGSVGVAYAADPTTHFRIDVAPQATEGEALNVTVEALDGSNNVDPGYTGTVHFTSTDARALLPADMNFTPADAGVKTFHVTLESPGLQTITATDTVDGTILGSANVNFAYHFQIAAPAGTMAGAPLTFVVTALDALNNVIPTYTGTVQFTSTDGQATLPPSYTFTSGAGGDNGVHTFTGVTLRTAGVQTISVADPATSSATGGTPVAVSPGAAAVFDITFPSTVTAGAAFALAVTVRDAYGNVVPSFTGTVTFASSDKNASLPANYTFTTGQGGDNGVHTFSLTLKTAGTESITVTEVGDPLLTDIVEILVTNPAGKGNKK
jgi:hypothetical protein